MHPCSLLPLLLVPAAMGLSSRASDQEATTCTPNPLHGPCYQANPGVGGCEDLDCCRLVCSEFNPVCCQDVPLGWIQLCADQAVQLCYPDLATSVCIATGDDPGVDGFLEVCSDGFGSWTTTGIGGGGDRFNPIPSRLDVQAPTNATGVFIFVPGTQGRLLLSTNSLWQDLYHDVQYQQYQPEESVMSE